MESQRPLVRRVGVDLQREVIHVAVFAHPSFDLGVERRAEALAARPRPGKGREPDVEVAGPDGLIGTSDDGTYRYFNRTVSGSRNFITNDPPARQTYKGLEITDRAVS